jgi:hypothetical protein
MDLSKMDPITREETETLEMLYRRHLQFAVGHGVSVHVTRPELLAEKAKAIETEFVPQAEVAQQTSPTSTDPGFASLSKSGCMRLIHSGGHRRSFLGGDVLDCRGDRRLIVKV